jgi:hypothetical protein
VGRKNPALSLFYSKQAIENSFKEVFKNLYSHIMKISF